MDLIRVKNMVTLEMNGLSLGSLEGKEGTRKALTLGN
jgi:hypothetical protein